MKNTPRFRHVVRLTLGLALVALTVGCSGVPQFYMPQTAIDRMDPYEVDRHQNTFSWKERLDFGPWHVHDVDRGWTKPGHGHGPSSVMTIGGDSWHIAIRDWQVFEWRFADHWVFTSGGPDDVIDVVRDYSFAIDEAGALAWTVQCGQELDEDEWEALTCALRDETTGHVWVLALANQGAVEPFADWIKGSTRDVMTGMLSDGVTTWDVIETFRLENVGIGSLEDPTGYYFLQDNKMVGSVDLIADQGRVWLDDQRPRAPRAAAAAALLLYRSLRVDEARRARKNA